MNNVQRDSPAHQIREELVRPILEAGDLSDPSRLQVATQIWRSAAEAEKIITEVDSAKQFARSEKVRFWVPILAPLIGSLVIAATFFFQILQFHHGSEVEEDQKWRDVLQRAQDTNNKASVIGMTLIKSYLGSPKHGKEARQIAVYMLGNTSDRQPFDILFPSIVEDTNPGNLRDLAAISYYQGQTRDLASKDLHYEQEYSKQFDKWAKSGHHGFPPRHRAGHLQVMSMGQPTAVDLEDIKSDAFDRRHTVDDVILKLLQDPRYHPGANQPRTDISGVDFLGYDLSHRNFSGTVLDNATLQDCNVKGANFDNVPIPKDCDWYKTAWWKATRVSPGLLNDLKANYPFKTDVKYRDYSNKDQNEYLKDIARLEGNR